MRPDDILEKIHRKPFQPFRVFMSDGSYHDVRHPEFALVTRNTVVIGLPTSDDTVGPPAERSVDCSLLHVTRLAPIDQAAGATSG